MLRAILLLTLLSWSATFPHVVTAASLYLDPASTTLAARDATSLSVRLDVNEESSECVNAIDGVITYSETIEVVDVSIGQSIFSMWVERPVINKAARTITFAGGIPNGYCGRIDGDPQLTNVIADLIVRAPGETSSPREARIGFTPETTVYLNDGYGTALKPSTYGTIVTLTGQPGDGILDPWRDAVNDDTTPPAPFPIFFNTNPGGKYYISFNTVDKQTGIDQYQVMEESLDQFASFTWGRADAPWVTTRSPYILKDQSLNSVIYVKAIDKAGNEYIATYVPDESLRTMSTLQIITFGLFGLAGILVLALGVLIVVITKARRRRKLQSEIESHYDV